MFDWNDLRYLLAVARDGSTIAAARSLGVNQSTVQRRLAELERRLGQPVAERQAGGYRLTAFGAALLPHATEVERAVLAVQRRMDDARRDLSGVVRVTCPEPMVGRLTHSAPLERFRQRYPQLHLEFVMSDRYVDLRDGSADVALRSGDTDDTHLVGRKIGDSLWGVYASQAYVEQHGKPASVDEIRQHAVVAFDASMANHRASQWLQQVVPGARVVARHGSVLSALYAVKAGVGVAALPTAIAESEPSLQCVLGPIPELTRIWRILTLPQLRRVPRVAAFFDHMVDELDALRPIITG
ncbi:MAG: LysR family transcriptional regulator [Burkholderiaceae bacterium]|nr:LysR family transcriptional regulator [Burkholderiaceae bacterium]